MPFFGQPQNVSFFMTAKINSSKQNSSFGLQPQKLVPQKLIPHKLMDLGYTVFIDLPERFNGGNICGY